LIFWQWYKGLLADRLQKVLRTSCIINHLKYQQFILKLLKNCITLFKNEFISRYISCDFFHLSRFIHYEDNSWNFPKIWNFVNSENIYCNMYANLLWFSNSWVYFIMKLQRLGKIIRGYLPLNGIHYIINTAILQYVSPSMVKIWNLWPEIE